MSENNQNGNGNGSTNGKIFTLQPVGEDLNNLAPQLRDKTCRMHELTTGARMLYCYLSDKSFLRSVNQGVPGSVTKSKDKLGQELGVNERTIRRWGRELMVSRFVWQRVYWHNGFELTTWFLRGLADEQQEFWKDADPRYGRTRETQKQHRSSMRGTNGQFCPKTAEETKSTNLPEKSAVSGQECPTTTDNPDRGQRTPVTVVNGHSCPSSTDNPDRGQRTPVTVVNGHSRPLSADTSVRAPRTPVSELEETPDVKGVIGEVSFKRSTGFNARNGSGGVKKLSAENHFIYVEVPEAMELWKKGHGKVESSSSGVWWRQSYRANPDLIRRVLAETVCAIKERKIKTDPGKYAVDLWKRWSKDLLKEQFKQKAAARTAAR